MRVQHLVALTVHRSAENVPKLKYRLCDNLHTITGIAPHEHTAVVCHYLIVKLRKDVIYNTDFEKISFIEAVSLLGEKLGINISNANVKTAKKDDYFDIYELANKFYQNSLFTSLGKNAIEYLENRNIDKETIKKFGIGLSIQKVSLTEYLKNKKYTISFFYYYAVTLSDGVTRLSLNLTILPILLGKMTLFFGPPSGVCLLRFFV